MAAPVAPDKAFAFKELHKQVSLQALSHSPWMHTEVKVITTNSTFAAGITALKANFSVTNSYNRTELVPLTTFVSTYDHKVWFGPELKYYIQTSDRIFSCQLDRGNLLWGDNLLEFPKTKFGSPEAIVDYPKLMLEWNKAIEYSDVHKTTNLSNLYDMWIFMDEAAYSKEVAISDIELIGNIVKIRIEKQPNSGFHGEAWIDLETKKVIKAFENGSQVFPKL